MSGKTNTSVNGTLSFLRCLQDLLVALNPNEGAIAFQNSHRKYAFKERHDLCIEDCVRFFCPPDSHITADLIRFATTDDITSLNSVYRHISSFGNLCAFCSSLELYLKENLIKSQKFRDLQNEGDGLPSSQNDEDTCCIDRLNKLFSEDSIYAKRAVHVCPPNQSIHLNASKKDHEYAGTAALILISLIPPERDRWRSSYIESLKDWVTDTFFPPDGDALGTYIDFAIGIAAAENVLNGQLISEIKTSAIDSYDFYNDIDLNLTEELGKSKDRANPQKLDCHITKSRRPSNEGDDIK